MSYPVQTNSGKTETLPENKKAFEDIYCLFYPKLYNYGRKFTSDTDVIEDSIQEIFIWCWAKQENFLRVKSLKNYLFLAFRHELLRAIRRSQQGKLLLVPEDNFTLELAIDEYLISSEFINEQQLYLKNALACITSRQREVIFLKFFENMTYEDIAKILNVSIKAVYKLFGRAIKELRQYTRSHKQPTASVVFSFLSLALNIFL